MKRLWFALTCILLMPALAFAQNYDQTSEWMYSRVMPSQIPPDRERLTADNAAEGQQLAIWGLGQVSTARWLGANHIGISAARGTWMYDLQQPQSPQLYTPIRFTDMWPTTNLDGVIGHTYYRDATYDSQPNMLAVWRFDGIFSGLLLHQRNVVLTGETVDPIRNLPIVLLDAHDGYVAAAQGNTAFLYQDAGQAEPLQFAYPPSNRTDYVIEAGAFNSDGSWLVTIARAVISDQLIISLWDTESKEQHILYQDDYLPLQRLLPRWIHFHEDANQLLVFSHIAQEDENGLYSLGNRYWRWDLETYDRLPDTQEPCDSSDEGTTYSDFTLLNLDSGRNRVLCFAKLNDGSTRSVLEVRELTSGVLLSRLGMGDFIGIQDPQHSISPDGRYFAAPETLIEGVRDMATYTPGVRIFDLEAGVSLDPFLPHPDGVVSLDFGPDGRLLTATREGKVAIWEIGQAEPDLQIADGELLPITQVAFSTDGNWLLSAAPNPYPFPNHVSRSAGALTRWEVATGTSEVLISGEQYHVSGIAFSPDGEHLYLGDLDGTLHLWNAQTFQASERYANGQPIDRLLLSSNGHLLIAIDINGLTFWDTRTMTIINRIEQSQISTWCTVQFYPGEAWLRVCDEVYRIEADGERVARWSLTETPPEIQRWVEWGGNVLFLPGLLPNASNITSMFPYDFWMLGSIALNPAGDLVALGGRNGVISLVGVPSEEAGS
jgi:WD40 repeat protein